MVKDPTLKAIGEQIRGKREALDLAQDDFAAQAGLDRAYYGGIERGQRNVAALNLVRIAKALGVEVGELFPPIKKLAVTRRGRVARNP